MESSSDFRGDLEDIVRAGRCGVVSESTDKQRRYVKESEEDSSNNPSNLSKLSLLDEESYFNFYCKQRDYGFCNSNDVFGDPFSNTRDPLISSSTSITLDDEQMLHLDDDEICNNINGFIMPLPAGGYNSCRRSSSSSGLIVETLTENSSDDNNINSKKRVIHGSVDVQQQQQQVDDSNNNDKMVDQCMMINNNNHQREGSRLVQISNDFNHATAAAGGAAPAPAPAGCSFVYDYSPSSTAMVNSCNTSTGTKDVDLILNMNPNKVGSVGCMSVSNRIHEISSSSQRTNPILKRRKSQQAKKVVCIPAPGGANSRQGGGEVVPSDLWAWRKYGQKPIKGSPYPRGYYRCSSSKGCSARKQVERSRTDPTMLVITYTSEHNHPWPTQRNALAGSTRTFTATSPPPLSITTPPSSSAPAAANSIYKHDHPRKLACTTLSTHAVTAVDQCRLEVEDDDGHHNNSSSFGVSSSGEAEPILQFVGDDHDNARNSQQMPFSSLLMGGSSTPEGGMISIINDDQKQLFSSSSSSTLFDWPLSNQPL